MGSRVVDVAVLIRPERRLMALEQLLHASEPGGKELAGEGVGNCHLVDRHAESAHETAVLCRHAAVDHADQRQVKILADAGQRQPGVAGGGLDDGRQPRHHAPLVDRREDHRLRGAILGAAHGIEHLELGEDGGAVAIAEKPFQGHERRTSDRRQDAGDGSLLHGNAARFCLAHVDKAKTNRRRRIESSMRPRAGPRRSYGRLTSWLFSSRPWS